MHGLWAAIGPTAERRNLVWKIPAEVQRVSFAGATIERRSPPGQPLPEWQATSRSGKVCLCIDGELIVRGLSVERGLGAHLGAFADAIEEGGVDSAFERLDGGSFVAVVIEDSGRMFLLRDPLGTIPVYDAQAGSDWLVSTNPLSLARSDGVDDTPDRIGLASVALVGYTIGTRHVVRGVRTVRPGFQYVREADGNIGARPLPLAAFAQLPTPGDGPSAAAVAAAVQVACRRLASTRVPTAHMQSGGMDSRLILASWPAASPIVCYGYGDPRSAEVTIAREVAEVRGVPYRHAQPNGDEVAQLLEGVYEANGLMVYPARWFLAERMAADGHLRVLDGFAGDFLLGYLFYAPRRTLPGLIDKLLARFWDTAIDNIGLEALAEDIYSNICELPVPAALAGYLNADFVAELERARGEVVADIHEELVRLRPANNSVMLLVRNFMVANRSAHTAVQQGVMSRRALSVGFPFAADYDFLKLALSIPLSRATYRRLPLDIFRENFPRYADVRYAGSMLPLRRSAAAHQTSSFLLGRGLRIPGLTGPRPRSPNNWSRWLRESAALRELTAASLQAGGIASPDLSTRLLELGEGTATGSGKLLHLASIGRWLSR